MNDLIRRADAIDGLDGHRVERRNLNDWQEGWNAALDWVQGCYLEDLPSAQKTQLSTEDTTFDCISRAEAIDALKRDEEYNEDIPNRADGVRDAIITIMGLPSAQPEPEHTMEEFMYGQELGDPEDGSL